MKPRKFLKAFCFSLALALCLIGSQAASAQQRAAWMRQARMGVMTHFLAEWINPEAHESAEAWNKMVDGIDVKGLAGQLESSGIGYYLITLGQNSGFYCTPNATYDRFVGISPGRCARRDLIADLYEELHPRGIRLMVYLPAGAPSRDKQAVAKLQWKNGPYPNREFQAMWEQVIREWSTRWGTKVAGWWFDGCFWPNTMYRGKETPNFESFAAAARAGNPDAVLAFNPGVVNRTISISPHEDYIAGEISDPTRIDIRRVYEGSVDGAQMHMLSYLGSTWGKGPKRFSDEEALKFTRQVLDQNGVVTWDVPIQPGGLISDEFLQQLRNLSGAIRKR
jgi:hypothetical protein